MQATNITLANILQISGTFAHYHVPKYQREYTWKKSEWEQLLLDIEENDIGYFMGSIICIDDNSEQTPNQSVIFEVVDGQQRLMTLSIILMLIYSRLKEMKKTFSADTDDDEESNYQVLLSKIKDQLVNKKSEVTETESGHYFKDKSNNKYCFLRVNPSTQNRNLDDYKHILNVLGIIQGDFRSKRYGTRRISKAYNYFRDHLPSDYEGIKKMLHKINSLQFIHISVASSSDAFVLFESLNNRGIPLSAVDIIKNKMLAYLEKHHMVNIEDAFDEWQRLLGYLPEYKDQERFLRQYYNAFKIHPEIKINRITKATKSTLIEIYEQLIKKSAKNTFDDLLKKAKVYNIFIEPDSSDLSAKTKKHLLDLYRIGAAASYLFLLYLYNLPANNIEDKKNAIDKILQFFINYYARRNITDFPNTRDLDAINMEVIENCDDHIQKGNKIDSAFVIEKFMTGKGKPSELPALKKGLEDNLFHHNSGMARFVLTVLDAEMSSIENEQKLWARSEKGLLVWTVEHILPQGEKIPTSWVDMIAGGDKKKAERIHGEWVHCLGNLTLSGYNSKLSNEDFKSKQSLHKNQRFLGHVINIGYKNNLKLNNLKFPMDGTSTNLATIKKWTEESIKARNDVMVDILIRIFAFDGEEQELSRIA